MLIIQQIFDAATGLHGAHQRLGEDLSDARQRTADWQGEGGDAFRADLGKTVAGVQADGLAAQRVAAAAQRAEADVGWCRSAIDGIDETARANGWSVTPDWRVDTSLANAAGKKADPQPLQTQLDQVNVRAHQADHELGVAVRAAVGETQLDADGNEAPARLVDDEKPDPTVNNDATTPQLEKTGDDLDASIPNTGINIGGDGRDHYPLLNGKDNPLPVGDDERPIPTGTAVGPDGQQLAFYSTPAVHDPPGSDALSNNYVTPNSAIVDLSNPSAVIGNAPVAQASGVYDKNSNTMFVVGNPGDGHGDTRQLWQSAPIDPAHPNAWASGPWTYRGDVLAGNRENQIIAMQGGGYLLTGSTDFGPVTAVAASTPQGLIGNPHVVTVVGSDGPGGVSGVYGPTVVTDHFNPATGTDTIGLRVSQFAPPGSPEGLYDPRTFTSTFTVSQPPAAPPP